jgi:hypothetical protein
MRYAAACSAVAAADLLAAWARAPANLDAQSGRILSVVMTPGAVAESDAPRRREGLEDSPADDSDV